MAATPEGMVEDRVRATLEKWMKATASLERTEFIKLFIQTSDGGCYQRAQDIAKACDLLKKPLDIYESEGKTASIQPPKDKGLVQRVKEALATGWKADRVVVLKVNAKWGGAGSSIFKGFHYVLVIATGGEAEKRFCVVYDPDVTATERASAKWSSCQKSDKDTIIREMILGKDRELGALVRYVYES
jgi:hypothetical protein